MRVGGQAPLWEGRPGQVSPRPPSLLPGSGGPTAGPAFLGVALPAASLKPSRCLQHFDLLYKTVQRLLVKAKTQ